LAKIKDMKIIIEYIYLFHKLKNEKINSSSSVKEKKLEIIQSSKKGSHSDKSKSKTSSKVSFLWSADHLQVFRVYLKYKVNIDILKIIVNHLSFQYISAALRT
jgi:hypothetical protein